MTKARDLAGFASSSVTTTASDGLVLKGDGSTTDVIIKNGANATVATVADGTTNLAVVGAVTGALAQGAIQVGNSSGVAAPLTIGSNAQLLQSNGTTAAWATVSTAPDTVVFPNFASPTNTYTTSGTWSKGSLSDNDYVWIYLLAGGASGFVDKTTGFYAGGSAGGAALILYGQAKIFDGGAYAIGAGGASATYAAPAVVAGGATTFTLTSTYGSSAVSTAQYAGANPFVQVRGGSTVQATTLIEASPAQDVSFLFGTPMTGWSGISQYNGVDGAIEWNGGVACAALDAGFTNSIFGGGNGGGSNNGLREAGGSFYAGAGGAAAQNANGTAGTYPSGGGGSILNTSNNGSVSGAGANGNVRVYHV
tara:strand:+ start:2391 stop:3485 length:1095 start_codon:yes stop_codon:yes gene_type:complete